jgi:SAM-dependent methyltransferase
MKKRLLEKIFFDQPALYKMKRFVIEDVIWKFILSRIFRLKLNPMPDITSKFAGQRVLVAACGPGDVTTGPPIIGASQVTAFDFSRTFATQCAIKRKDWHVYCSDVCNIPHRDNEFDISVIYSSLHHIPIDAQNILRELSRVTQKQIIIVEGLLPTKGLLRWLLLIWWRTVDGGYHYYTIDELKDKSNRLGLRLESSNLFSPIKHMWLGVLDC